MGARSGSGKERRGRTGGKGRGRCLKKAGKAKRAARAGSRHAAGKTSLCLGRAAWGGNHAGCSGLWECLRQGQRRKSRSAEADEVLLNGRSFVCCGVCPEPKTADLGAYAFCREGLKSPCLRIVLPFSRKPSLPGDRAGKKRVPYASRHAGQKRRPAQATDAEIVRGARAAGRV